MLAKKAPHRAAVMLNFSAMKSSPAVDLGLDHSRRESTEFDRFGQLVGKLVKVPKSEIDDKRKTP